MRGVAKSILLFLKHAMNFAYFLLRVLINNNFKNPITRKKRGAVNILGNGPSLKYDLTNFLEEQNSRGADFIVLNYFAFDDAFFEIKPQHYCLADPMFFQRNHREADVRKLYGILEDKVDWNIKLYIPTHSYKKFKGFSGISNKNVEVVRINTNSYFGYEGMRNFFYKKGLATPPVSSVVNLAIYVALNRGYRQLNLYGVDHNFFESICVNDQGQLCNKEVHFYGEETKLTPIRRSDNSEVYKIGDFLQSRTGIFRSHDLLSGYSKYLNVTIVNHTKGSLIDSYERAQG